MLTIHNLLCKSRHLVVDEVAMAETGQPRPVQHGEVSPACVGTEGLRNDCPLNPVSMTRQASLFLVCLRVM